MLTAASGSDPTQRPKILPITSSLLWGHANPHLDAHKRQNMHIKSLQHRNSACGFAPDFKASFPHETLYIAAMDTIVSCKPIHEWLRNEIAFSLRTEGATMFNALASSNIGVGEQHAGDSGVLGIIVLLCKLVKLRKVRSGHSVD